MRSLLPSTVNIFLKTMKTITGRRELYLSHLEDDIEQSFINIDFSAVDRKKQKLITRYFSKDCCKNKCRKIIARKMIEHTRNNYLEISK